MPPRRLDASAPGFETEFSAFLGRNRQSDENVDRVVTEIVADVRARGDAALVEYTRKFDRVDTDAAGLRIGDAERRAAAQLAPAAQREALVFAARRIEAFHRTLLPKDVDFIDATGTRLGARYRPLDSVGVYVPGGTAAYPSSVLMNIVPAKVAGVPRIVMVVPTPDGVLNPLVMLAADIAGADEVWRIGGAQAVAALAYGTQSIKPVDKITGPGNAYVAAIGKTSMLAIQHALDLYHAENDRYPKDYDEFMTVIIKANNIALPKLPPYQEYGYDEKEHKLVILEYKARKDQPSQ